MGNKLGKILIITIILVSILFSGCSSNQEVSNMVYTDREISNIENNTENVKELEALPTESEVDILAVGDIMVHGPQLKAQYNRENGEYDFSNNFKYIMDYIKKADIAICNLETTLAGKEKKFSSYPKFNSPDGIVRALKNSGFDIAVTANNHTMDMGELGVKRTMSVLDEIGLDYLGTQKSDEEDNYIIKNINNMKLGIIAYTYEIRNTLNGLPIPSTLENKINTFNYDDLDNDLEKIQNEIKKMKENGAEIIVFYIHWGNEYKLKPNEYQKKIAEALCEFGVDIILGSHPHVIQPLDIITSSKGTTTLVSYSLGNFLSNQRNELMNNRYTEDGIMLNIKITKNLKESTVKISEIDYIPTWVYKYWDQDKNKNVYEILPLNELDTNKAFNLNETQMWRANNSKKNTVEIIKSNSKLKFK